MAIAYDSSALGTETAADATTLTFAHTCTGINLVLIVAVSNPNGNTTGVTYGGTAMTAIYNGGNGNSMWYLGNPLTGANNVVVTRTSGTEKMNASSASYTGASATQPDSYAQDSANTNPKTLATTVVGSNCWLVGMNFGQSNNAGNPSTDKTVRQTDNWVGAAAYYSNIIADTNGTVATGSQGMQFTIPATSAGMNTIVMSLTPWTATVTTITWTTLTYALTLGTLFARFTTSFATLAYTLTLSTINITKIAKFNNLAKNIISWVNKDKN